MAKDTLLGSKQLCQNWNLQPSTCSMFSMSQANVVLYSCLLFWSCVCFLIEFSVVFDFVNRTYVSLRSPIRLFNTTSLNSKLFHMDILNCWNMTLQYVTINATGDSLNTDGIHMGRSTGVNISDAIIKTGDDSLSIGDGSQHINVEKVTCGPGHGISVGSLGKYHNEEPVVGVTVKNCTLINTMNGIRVKTWPDSPASVATDLHFEDIIMNNVGNPILINQEYCPYDQCQAKVLVAQCGNKKGKEKKHLIDLMISCF